MIKFNFLARKNDAARWLTVGGNANINGNIKLINNVISQRSIVSD